MTTSHTSPSPSPTSTFDGGEYFLDREAERGKDGMLAMSSDDNENENEHGGGYVSVRKMLGGEGEDGEATPTATTTMRRRRKQIKQEEGVETPLKKISGEGDINDVDQQDSVGVGNGNVNVKAPPDPSKKKRFIRFAPLRVPIHRRLQTLAVLWHATALALSAILFWSICAIPLWWPIVVPYLLHLLFSPSHHNGASPYIRSNFLRSLPLWSWYNAYFPIRFHRSVPLDPNCNYIFGYSPHGIISFGAWGCFVTDSDSPAASRVNEEYSFSSSSFSSAEKTEIDTPGGEYGVLGEGYRESRPGYKVVRGGGFKKLFPGIKNTLLTLDGNFRIPIYREYLLAMGLASVSRRSCEALLGMESGGGDRDKVIAESSNTGNGRNRSSGGSWEIRYPSTAIKADQEDFNAQIETPLIAQNPKRSKINTSIKKQAKLYTSYLSPFAWTRFFLRILKALIIPIIPPPLREWYLRRRSRRRQIQLPSSQAHTPRGKSITIVLGGARESLLSQPHTMNIILHRRRGFIKLALKSPNTAVVPCLAFGENDVYETLKHDPIGGQNSEKEQFKRRLERVQMGIKKLLGFTVPVFWARGVFNYDVGLLPFRCAVDVVVGRPIFPPISEGPRTREEEDNLVTEMQKLYEEELMRIWEEWKDVFAKGRKGELDVVM